ncbi:MAG: hypothetical protein IKI21_03750 [Oscillospiraceae bacterium]|nr:hypothetical protein [Oscillospiraceae bacterium]
MDDNKAFFNEIEQYPIPDLELICKTQKDLYSAEEMAVIEDVLQKKRAAAKLTDDDDRFMVTLFCVAGLLSFLIGAVIGVAMLIKGAKGHPRWTSAGKKTLLAAFISLLIQLFLWSGGFSV